jgi:prophage tail gpP-like protein
VRGEAVDSGVRRTDRVLVLHAEESLTKEQAKIRAQWEATVRAARAAAVSVTVQGWRQATGELWPVNARVAVRAPRLGIDGPMLITQATYEVSSEGGTTTQLSLKRPDAFTPEPVFEKRSKVQPWDEIRRGV